ncbi:hypothetical protein NIES4075_03380 [Tolypothrix sp. NIES-4075]|uniref:hypothetical protein n=1 Tax=Tolypothrix sp. NIES-4075 TaxID=2005459 RepID=UPI000B5C89DF|nr:hypothetical protein [Tolypothrix sp. NIES-4075]GAX39382.1 hypothetical protein NIES4075_03380 [Tolypothrix sp. NIES-4075]
MEHWQFLIQKQGDRSWHTLESPNLEILEGRYRVLARSNRPNIDVEVRVIHSSTQEVPLLRRVQKRSRRTNNEGLMAVIPFTHLKPGVWELRCSGDLMSDMLGKSWQYSIKIQVLPESAVLSDVKRLDDSEHHLSPGSDTFSHRNSLSTAAAQTSTTIHNTITVKAEPIITTQSNAATTEPLPTIKEEDAPITPVWVKGETAEQILQNLLELALPASESLLHDEAIDVTPEEQAPPLLLTLEQETYVARWGETLCVNGRVELKQELLSDTSDLESVCAAEVRIEMRSPQKSEILTQVRQPIPEKILPCTISSQIQIPADCESKLILADMSLYGALAGIGEVTLLASQSFTITADVTQLLAITTAVKHSTPELDSAMSGDKKQSFYAPPTIPKEPLPSTLDLQLFNLVKSVRYDQNLVFQTSPKKALPPRIDPRTLRKSAAARRSSASCQKTSPELPTFSRGQTKMIAAAVVLDTSSKSQRLENTDTITERQVPIIEEQTRLSLSAGSTFRYLTPLKPLPGDFEAVQSNVQNALDYQTHEESPQLNTTVAESENAIDLEGSPDAPELVELDARSPDNSFPEVVLPQTSQIVTPDNPYSSPLIRKWMQTQGYSLPEPINVQSQNYYSYTPANQTISEEYPLSLDAQTPTADVNSPLVSDIETQQGDIVEEDTEIQHEDKVSEVSLSPQVPQLPPAPHLQIQPTWLAQEIVVDDTPTEDEADTTQSGLLKQKNEPVTDLSVSLALAAANWNPLPIPQLHVPEGELIAGKSVRVRVHLPYVREQMAVKLWMEDCQTRWLLDSPHLLKNLLPNSLGDLEVMTQLNIPFGCLEIRLEAIAIDTATQQESHKVTITRTVIPPDLPTLQLDELLGI